MQTLLLNTVHRQTHFSKKQKPLESKQKSWFLQRESQQQRNLQRVPNRKPQHGKDYWENIFREINMDYIPLDYVNTLVVTFQDKTIWEIDMMNRDLGDDPETVLDEFFNEYEETISTVDFRLDLERLKTDISKRTNRFLKLNK
jgi:hypothetical protein